MMEQNIALLRQHCYQLGIFLCARHLYYFFRSFFKMGKNGIYQMGTLLFVQSTSNQIKHHLRASSSFSSFFSVGSIVRCLRLAWFIVFIYYSVKAAPILSLCYSILPFPLSPRHRFYRSCSPSSGPLKHQCFRSTNNSRVHIITLNTAIHSTFCKEEKLHKNHEHPNARAFWVRHEWIRPFIFQ